MLYGLTPRQKKILDFIREYIGKNKYSPSYREIMVGCGEKSLGNLHKIIVAIAERGYLVFLPRKSRSLTICGDGHEEKADAVAEKITLEAYRD